MNKKQRLLVLASGFLIIGLWISLANLHAIFVLDQPAPFPPISTILYVTGIILIYWSDKT